MLQSSPVSLLFSCTLGWFASKFREQDKSGPKGYRFIPSGPVTVKSMYNPKD